MSQEHSVTQDFRPVLKPKYTFNFNMGVILAIIVQTVGIVWFAAQLQHQVTVNTADILEMKANCCSLTRTQLDDILAARDVKIDSLNQQFSDFRLETRAVLQRIEQKI